MKLRSGFVSNSSSSSFIVAVPKKAVVCKCCNRSDEWMLQAFAKYLTTLSDRTNKLHSMTSAEQVDDYYKEELSGHIKSKDYALSQIKEIEELEKTPKIFDDYLRLKKQLDTTRYALSLKNEVEVAQYVPIKDTLSERRKRLENHIKDYDKKLKEIKDIIAKVKKAIKNDCSVYSFTIDNWATDAESMLKALMAEKVVEVIHSVYT